ncbi:MAG: hypothetical protein QXM86_04990, partial [Candidatus Bathyarchaeia archaeon]
LIDKNAMRYMRLRFFGYSDEPNDVKFISGFLGSEYVKELRNLDHGSFVAYSSGKLSLVHIEPYSSNTSKINIPQFIEPIQQLPKQTDVKATLDFLTFLMWFCAVLYAIIQLRVF